MPIVEGCQGTVNNYIHMLCMVAVGFATFGSKTHSNHAQHMNRVRVTPIHPISFLQYSARSFYLKRGGRDAEWIKLSD